MTSFPGGSMQAQGTTNPPPAPAAGAGGRRVDEEIAALLEEYRTLREEITQRISARMQLIGFAGIISALLAASDHLTYTSPSPYVSALTLLLAVLWVRGSNQAIQRIGRHLRGIEERINALAAQAWQSPEPLLTWETSIQSRRRAVGGLAGWVGRTGGWYTH
ncbi:hypothetical protein [Actinacidiphila rubida]|uniref:Uncharacterized protein n=1 Tax=Actinacidiphila rubida TaxID=310780 RepID=A0A1H8EA90_9ACTN|nr:hypothetical protein [Actinacidiphila rubida]SEN16346.1 hypothetical protein SAMN05216267_100297 [Actinacidiphila rubida]